MNYSLFQLRITLYSPMYTNYTIPNKNGGDKITHPHHVLLYTSYLYNHNIIKISA